MSGERNLDALLHGMDARLDEALYGFACLKPGERVPDGLNPRMVYAEEEGLTLILTQDEAKAHGLDMVFPCRCITLHIHSALEAVGFLARICQALAAEGISTNAVSAYYHDHLFVPLEKADAAMECLKRLSQNA